MATDTSGRFGELLRRYRVAGGLSQKELAERAGLSAHGVSDLERGARRSPHPGTVARLSRALGLDSAAAAELRAVSHRRLGWSAASAEQAEAERPAQAHSTRLDTWGVQRPEPVHPPRSGNLPAPHRSLIGREGDAEVVRELLVHAPGRLLTLTGTGGCGKTQLALKVATDLVATVPDGVWFVDLAAIQSGDLVPYAVATVLGRNGRAGQAIEDAVLEYLKDRDVLVVLDNCEHLVDACANLAEWVLSGCPRVRLLATSRERLRIAGETAWRVPSLTSPDPQGTLAAGELLAYPAVQLFVERARAILPGFTLGPANASAVARVCAQLEGLPLALELAAARVAALSLQELSERLQDSFRLLAGGSRSAPGRQQTLRATLDWSYGLLSSLEQTVFRRLAVFAGGWGIDAAESVCSGEDVPAEDALEALTRLVDKSLVVVGEHDGRSRYRLLEPIRQYARELLVSHGDFEPTRRRHATFFLGFANSQERDANVGGPGRGAAVDALLREYRNLEVALRWSLDSSLPAVGLRLAWALQFVWKFRLPAGEGRLWLESVLALPGAEEPTRAYAVALLSAAMLAWTQHDYIAAATHYDKAFPLVRRLGDPWILFVALADRGSEAQSRGDVAAAVTFWEEGLAVTRESGDRTSEAIVLNNLGRLQIYGGNYAAGRARCEAALDLARHLGDTWVMALALEALASAATAEGRNQAARLLATECVDLQADPGTTSQALRTLSQVAMADGEYAEARAHLIQAVTLIRDSEDRADALRVVEAVTDFAAHQGHPEVALRLAAATDAGWESIPEGRLYRTDRRRWLTSPRKAVRTDVAERLWAQGRMLSLTEAVELADIELLHTSSTSTAPANPLAAAPLTPRQLEVAALVGQGLTNRQVGERLIITQRAAAAHVEHILDKLGVGSRAQIAVWASERGLLRTHSS